MENFMSLNEKNLLTNYELEIIKGGTLKRPPRDEDINPPINFSSNSLFLVKKFLQ